MDGKIVVFFVAFVVASSFAQWDPNFAQDRTTIVHLFEWRWDDIAAECERFLGPRGFGGVQTSPANENAVINGMGFRTWWERYQLVSYKLETRSGTEQQFQNMVRRCNAVGVRIYVDAVLNHMTSVVGAGVGTGGSYFNTDNKQYDGVPFTSVDITPRELCSSSSGQIEDWDDINQVRNCELLNLRDVYGGSAYVREKQIEFLNRMIGYGVAGFRFDAVKCIWPEDLGYILGRLNYLPVEHGFAPGSRPFVFQEVIQMLEEEYGGKDYFHLGRVTEFRHGRYIGEVLRGYFGHTLKNLYNFGSDWGMFPSPYALGFVDNHDNQRGHGAGGEFLLTHKEPRLYKMATAFILAWPYSVTRIMSSYSFENSEIGPPSSNDVINPVPIENDGSCGVKKRKGGFRSIELLSE